MQTSKEESCFLFSSDVFPQTTHIKNKSAIPWGVGIHPLNPKVTTHKPTISQLDIPRCQKCFGYLNMYCLFDSKTWQCPLCHFKNKFDKTNLNNRYATSIERSRCEECLFPNITMEIPLSKSTRSNHLSDNAREILAIVVDCTGTQSFLTFSKSIITTILEHYHEQADFLLFTSGNRLGIYNIKHTLHKILYTRLTSSTSGFSSSSPTASSSSFSIPLKSIMSYEESGASLKDYRTEAIKAVQSIQQLQGEFCFAETLQFVTDYLHSLYQDGLLIGGKVLAFINQNSSNPSINPYQDTLFPPKTERDAMNRLSVSNSIYTKIIEQFQEIGLSIDILNNITDSTNKMNPVLLQQLALQSNGCYFNIDLHDPSSLQSLQQYALSFQKGEYGFDCVFRIRSSGGISIHSIQTTSLLHKKEVGIQGIQFSSNSSSINHFSFINSNSVIPFDFQYLSPSGSTISPDDFPLIQLVTEYTTMTKIEENGEIVYKPVRRMLINTVEYKVSSDILEIYQSCNPSTIIFILLHKTFRDLQTKGFEESRLLLKEWLLSFLSHYIAYVKHNRVHHNVDYAFNTIPKLSILPKFIYSCIVGDFLRLSSSSSFSKLLEEQTILLHLTPSQLSRYLYPQLSAYKDENTISIPRMNLSTRTILAVDRPIYVLVGFRSIIVYYAYENNPSPPSSSSKLAQLINSLYEESLYSYPLIIHYWCGEKNVDDFNKLMIDDNIDPQLSYSTFDSQIKDKAIKMVIQNK